MPYLSTNNGLILSLIMLTGVMFCIHYMAVAQEHNKPRKPETQQAAGDTEELSYKDLDELRHMHPTAEQWFTHKRGDTDFAFCTLQFVSNKESHTNIHGYYLDDDKAWKHLITYRVQGTGKVDLKFDDARGICMVNGETPEYKEDHVGVINLNVAK